jgi:photosystem II stability/assembly factor-like uncharacterized protein
MDVAKLMKVLGAFAVAALLGACATGGSEGGTAASPRPAVSSSPALSTVTEIRRASLSVPAGMAVHLVEFASATTGYALLLSDSPVTTAVGLDKAEYRAALFATTDGGRTWVERSHPHPVGRDQNMFVGGGDTVLLSVWPNDWYVSADAGRTFRLDRRTTPGDAPPEYVEAFADPQSPYRLECGTGGCLVVARRADGRTAAVAAQPRLGTGEVNDLRVDGDGRVWVLGLDRNRSPAVAMSPDGGRTWHRRTPPAQPGASGYDIMRFVASHDGAELWLMGSRPPGQVIGGAGRSLRLRKESGLPDMWRLDGDAWVSKGLGTSRPPNSTQLTGTSVVALGGGVVLVAGGRTPWLVNDEWSPVALPLPVAFVGGLQDGSVHAMVDPGTWFLGTWDGRVFNWVQVTLTVGG